MKSKRQIEKQTQKKGSTNLVETIQIAKKNSSWGDIARILSGPRRKRKELNLDELNKQIEGDKILVIPGKVLSQGELDKKVKISAFNFSEKAKQKLKEAKIEFNYIIDEIKKNPSGIKIKIIK